MADASALTPTDGYWFETRKGEAHTELIPLLNYLNDNQRHVEVSALRHARLYGNLDMGFGPYRYNRSASTGTGAIANRLTFNVVKSCVDTLTAQIAKNKPRPLFLTTGGDSGQQQRAKLLTKFTDAVFYANDAYKLGQQVFKDAAVFGTGIVAVFRRGSKIVFERVFPHEVTVDEAEAMYGKPGNYYRRKYLPRTTVMRMFKGLPQSKRNAIMTAKAEDPLTSTQNVADLILVTEAWHLASKRGATDGRYVVAIENATLVDEPYENDFPPFVFLRIDTKLLGFWGCGLAEQLIGTQLEINRVLKCISSQMHLLSAPKVLLEASSKIVSSHLTNDIGTLLYYVGTKPDLWLPQTVHPELFQHLQRLIDYAYQLTGVSQMSAGSQKPPGLESGAALREMNEITSERFIVVGQAYEAFFLEIAQRCVWLAKEIDAELRDGEGAQEDLEDEDVSPGSDSAARGFQVKLQSKKHFDVVNWRDIDLDEDAYIMQLWPVSQLPQTPSGRLATVQEMLQAGFIGPEDGIKLLDYPDLEQVNNMLTAAVEDLDMCIDDMLERGQYAPPEPMQNLELGLKRFQSAYLRARINRVPEERLELLRRWMLDAKDLLQTAQSGAPQDPTAVQPEAQERAPIPQDMLDPAAQQAQVAAGQAAPQPNAGPPMPMQ